ncbi:MAG: PPC domain-containing protein [Planctomycetales bacterium]|nr:PPC domain-containing protein [Planctomycetales bacterium]
MHSTRPFILVFALLLDAAASIAVAEPPAPNYGECRIDSIFPAGGQVGQTVTVEFLGNNGGLAGAKDIVVDGAPGIAVRDVTNVQAHVVRATFVIAADAVPGRRCVRVLNERSGLTNMLYFTVGRLAERNETEPNSETASAEAVDLPVIVNGRLDPAADVDFFRFSLRSGQHIVAMVAAHAIDSHGQGRDFGFVDADLQVLDAQGKVVAEAQDTLGLDPLVEFTALADGVYFARVQHVAFRGYPQAVYRLTLGDVPIPAAIFPPGGRRGTTVDVELSGPNIPVGTRQKVVVPADDPFAFQHVSFDGPTAGDHELIFLRGDLPEQIEAEPNDDQPRANGVTIPITVNGRFDRPGDVDWYRINLKQGDAVFIETTAQRFLRSPVDTLVEVFDAQGKKVVENDDGFATDYMFYFDFLAFDSQLTFSAPATGEYFVKVSEQSGTSGPRTVYRLTVRPTEPDFVLEQFPDNVPIWGPGTTAALHVKVQWLYGAFTGDVELSVEGLPPGWTGSRAVSLGSQGDRAGNSWYNYYGRSVFLTITAPPDAIVGTHVPFRVVGRAEHSGRKIERMAKTMSLYYSSDIGFFRLTPTSRVVVTKPQGPWLSNPPAMVTSKPGGTVQIPVRVHELGAETQLGLVLNLANMGVGVGPQAPKIVPIQDGIATLPFTLPDHLPPGDLTITVARTWRSDIRVGMPGPCTPVFTLRVEPK